MHIGKTSLFIATLLVISVQAIAAPKFDGVIGKTFSESTPGSEVVVKELVQRPNVVVWVIDDLGFGQIGSFGGDVATPTIDKLADSGVRFTNYHTTPICSSSRAALLTGRNSHKVHVGGHSAMAINYPGQDGKVPRAAGTIASNLSRAGYLTYAVGKWDHLPPKDASMAGPFTYWPSGQGFDRFYGFLAFDADNFAPALWSDHQPITIPERKDYHLTTDMADRAINWINMRDSVDPKRPFFMYWATGAVHAPHQAPQEYLDRYKGKFDQGWDAMREHIIQRQKALGIVPADTKLPPRPEDMQAWSELNADQKKMYSRAMEAFAAQLSHADEEFGRIVDVLKQRNELDNTIIIVTSDNGASAEGAPDGTFNEHLMANGIFPDYQENMKHYNDWGGPGTYPHYPFGWAVAGNTPFRYYKQTAYEGGVHVPLIVFWPKGIKAKGELRNQYHHVVDITPTILDLAGISPAEIINDVRQMPFDGKSMAPSVKDAKAKSSRNTQYYEMYGNRGIWHDGWKAVVPHRLKAWDFTTPPVINDDHWELYNLNTDINELDNVADRYPAKLAELQDLFDQQAKQNNVYPLTNTGDAQRLIIAKNVTDLKARDSKWTYTQPVIRIPEAAGPPVHTQSFTVSADIVVGENAEGVLLARAGEHGGMSLFILDGVPKFVLKNLDLSSLVVSAKQALPKGDAHIELSFDREKQGASVSLSVNGQVVGGGRSTAKLPAWIMSNNDGLDIGYDTGSQVAEDYQDEFPFNGKIKSIEVKIKP